MSTPVEARDKLDTLATELGDLSSKLADVSRKLEPVEDEYTAFMDNFEVGLWTQHVNGAKLPPKDIRVKLAHAQIDPELLGRYLGLTKSRERLQQRIRDLKAEVEAQRSILSALKAEMEATS